MFGIMEQFLFEYIRVEDGRFSKVINKKIYTVSNATLSHRQVNALDKDGLLDKSREADSEWRKFSLKDLLYLKVISKLKKFGIKHEQLTSLRDSFYKETNNQDKKTTHRNTKIDSEISIMCILNGVEMYLCVYEDGQTFFYDPIHYAIASSGVCNGYISIHLNTLMNEILTSLKKEPKKITFSLLDNVLSDDKYSKKEQDLISIVRNEENRHIHIEKKDDGSLLCKAFNEYIQQPIEIPDFVKKIEEMPFVDVDLRIENGKVVNHRLTTKIKLFDDVNTED